MKISLNILISFWEKFGVNSKDSNDVILRKRILTIISFIICIAGIIWGLMYLTMELYITSLFPFAYSFMVGASLMLFFFQKNFIVLLRIELFLILLLPFLTQLSLGGFSSSGVVIIWSLLCPMGALMFKGVKEFRFWFVIYISLIAILIYCDTYSIFNVYSKRLIISNEIKLLFFGMNIIAVSTIALSIILYFFNEQRKERLKNLELHEIRKKNDAILKDSEERYRLLVENSTDLIYKTDLKGNYTYINQVFINFSGYTESEILKMNSFDLINPD